MTVSLNANQSIKTVGAALRAYYRHLHQQIVTGQLRRENAIASVRTAVLTYTVRGWGGPAPAGKKASKAEVEEMTCFLDTLSLHMLYGAVEVQQQVFDQLGTQKKTQKVNRYHLRCFRKWVIEQGWLPGAEAAQAPPEVIVPYKHSFNKAYEQGKARLKNLVLTGRKRKEDFGLRPEEMNETLAEQMKQYAHFCEAYLNHRPATINSYQAFLYRLLGWLARYEGVPLSELKLTLLVPFVPLTVPMGDNEQDWEQDLDPARYLLAQEMLKRKAEGAAKRAEELFDKYCVFYKDAAHTQVATAQALITVAKFLYYRQTSNTNSKGGYNDIPVIRRLRQKRAEANNLRERTPKIVPYKERSVSWEEALEVLKQQQRKADELYHYKTINYKGKPKVTRQRRAPIAIACDIQRLLVICFFALIPPDRNRTVRELELGRTLIKGVKQGDLFVPVEEMAYPEHAKWYINLEPGDYKTGKIYGMYCAPIENVELAGGKTFYDYLQTWIDQYRPLFKPNHNVLFVKVKGALGGKAGQPMSRANLTSCVKALFYKFTGVPVIPQSLRKMYVTYLKDKRASKAEMEAAARAMKHSTLMQNSEYDEQELENKLAPIVELNQHLVRRVFQSADKQPLPLTADGQLETGKLTEAQIKQLLSDLRWELKRRQDPVQSASQG